MQSKVAKRSSRTYVQLLRFQLLGLPIHNVLLHHAIAALVDVLGDKKEYLEYGHHGEADENGHDVTYGTYKLEKFDTTGHRKSVNPNPLNTSNQVLFSSRI